jgi:hypothetical protein
MPAKRNNLHRKICIHESYILRQSLLESSQICQTFRPCQWIRVESSPLCLSGSFLEYHAFSPRMPISDHRRSRLRCNMRIQQAPSPGSAQPRDDRFSRLGPSSESCPNDQTCSSNADSVPLIALDGQGFGPNTYALFAVYWHENNQELWSAYAPVDNLGYTCVETPLSDCSSYSDARASAWVKAIDLSTGCSDTIL